MLSRCLVIFSLLSVTAPAAAQDPELNYARGVELRRGGDDEGALAEFREAQRIAPSGRFLAQIAFAEQALGRYGEALEHLNAALTTGDPWIQQQNVAVQDSLATLRAHAGQLQVDGGPAGAEIVIDGRVRGTLPLRRPIAVNAGTLALIVRADGHEEHSRQVSITPGQTTNETVQLVSGGGGGTASGATGTTGSGGGDDLLTILGIVALGVGAVSVGLTVAAYSVREDNAAHWNDDTRCLVPSAMSPSRGDQCPDQLSTLSTADALIGAGLGIGGAFLVGGAVLLGIGLTSGGGGESASVTCGSGPGLVSVGCRGSF